jgi:hypothetical protein
MKLRTLLTALITVLVAVFVAATGLVVVWRDDHHDRADIDRALADRTAAIQSEATKFGLLPDDPGYAVRLVQNGKVRGASGPKVELPVPTEDGLTTVRADGSDWRSSVTPLVTGARLQVLVRLDGAQGRHRGNVLLTDLMIVLTALLTAAGVWWLAGRVPEDRLPAFAAAARALRPGGRLRASGPADEAALASMINELLDRSSAAALPAPVAVPVRQAPAAPVPAALPLKELRAELENLLDNPEMPATQRHLILAAMLDTLGH